MPKIVLKLRCEKKTTGMKLYPTISSLSNGRLKIKIPELQVRMGSQKIQLSFTNKFY